jgi:hypothetical protein
MLRRALYHLVGFLLATAISSAQTVPAPADAYQVRYAANLNYGDSFINMTNTGVTGGFDPGGTICANVYAIDSNQSLVACCTCPLTPNHLKTLSVKNDLATNTLTPGVPTAITVALLATSQNTCNAATPAANNLASGLRAWGTTIHSLPTGTMGVTETPFAQSALGTTELSKLSLYCGFVQAIGSGYGICRSCRQGAQGSVHQ